MEVYFSQKFMPAYRYKLQSRLVPKYLCYAAEQYLKVDKQTIEKDYLTISNKAVLTALNSLKFSINNIYQVRILLHKIVESIL